MLKLRHLSHRSHRTRNEQPIAASDRSDRADLQIRNLLDDPRLRRALGLEGPTVARPAPRFDRRRLLDDAAA
jgi:phage pi2 protein 07